LFGKIVRVQNVGVEDVGVQNFEPLQRLKMILNDAGKIANECWIQIPQHFPNVILHEHIVMPNHIHGILEIKKPVVGVENLQPLQSTNVSEISVGVQNFEPLRRNEYQKIIPCSIGSIVRGFKIGVTKWFRNNTDIVNIWQRNYYEHVIRNEQSYEQIAEYIIENPNNWENDDFFNAS
jgi:REP element-mobilizing transposase RayT